MNKFISRMKSRIVRKNQNFVLIIVGPTGSGKSFTALKIAEEIDSNFSIEKVCFNPKEFMQLINSGKVKRGDVIVFDELGVTLGSRDWYTARNKMINYVLQTWRHMNIGLIVTVPELSFIDIQVRKLAHYLLETVRIDRTNQQVILKPFELSVNPKFGEDPYTIYPKIVENGMLLTMTRIAIGKPSNDIIKQYKIKKTEFTKTLKDDVERSIISIEAKSVNPEERFDFIVREVFGNLNLYAKEYGGKKRINAELVSANYKVGTKIAGRVKQYIESKINPLPVVEGLAKNQIVENDINLVTNERKLQD